MKVHLNSIELFLKGSNLSRGVVVSFAVISPIFILRSVGFFDFSPSVVLGAFIVAPSDLPGSLKRKVNGILIGILVVMVVTFLILIARPFPLLLLLLIIVFTFLISRLPVNGFRTSLVSFSGLIAIFIALTVDKTSLLEIGTHSRHMGLGGLGYLLVSFLFHKINPRKDDDQLLSDSFYFLGEFILLRFR